MKKTISLALCGLLAVLMLAGCGGGTPAASEANYIDVIRSVRSTEENQVFYIVADAATRESATSTVPPRENEDGGELFETPSPEEVEEIQHSIVFNPANGFTEDEMEKYAISLGFSITQAYGVAIVLPKEGQQQAVTDMMDNYVLAQQKAQENYLPDQYAIAKSAIVRTVATGEVVMVMDEEAEAKFADIEKALKG